jgi:anti-sigma B factor antagonist
MKITWGERRADAEVACIEGEIDGKTAAQAQAELLPAIERTARLVIELSQLTYMSSAGLRMLLLLYRQAKARSGQIVLVGVKAEIRDTMAMTGFLKFFAEAESVTKAMAAEG